MKDFPTEWRPLAVSALKEELAGCDNWILCGGHSVALLTGSDTRSHGDTDIGIFRSQLAECLRIIGAERVFLCLRCGGHQAWNGRVVPPEIHDIWITDRAGDYWVLQVLVFDDEGDDVVYRRDRRIKWAKQHHFRTVDGLRLLNPFVTFLFKANKTSLQEKEVHDLIKLIEMKP